MGARTLDTADSGPVLRGLFAVIMCQRGCGPFWCLSQKRICLQAHSGGWQVSVYCGQSTPVPCWLSTRGYPQVVFFFFAMGTFPTYFLLPHNKQAEKAIENSSRQKSQAFVSQSQKEHPIAFVVSCWAEEISRSSLCSMGGENTRAWTGRQASLRVILEATFHLPCVFVSLLYLYFLFFFALSLK